MLDFLQNNPLLAAGCAFCGYPALVGFIGYQIGRRVSRYGIPRLVWGQNIEGDEL